MCNVVLYACVCVCSRGGTCYAMAKPWQHLRISKIFPKPYTLKMVPERLEVLRFDGAARPVAVARTLQKTPTILIKPCRNIRKHLGGFWTLNTNYLGPTAPFEGTRRVLVCPISSFFVQPSLCLGSHNKVTQSRNHNRDIRYRTWRFMNSFMWGYK